MRAPVLLIVTSLALVVTGCASVEPVGPGPETASARTAPPEPVVDYDWFLHQGEGEARLVYGLAESDDMRLGLDCTRASGKLVLSALGGPNAEPEIRLESGDETGRFPAQSEPSQLHDGVFLTAEAAADDPVFRRFRGLGWVSLWLDGERQSYAPHPPSAPNIERFFAFCG